MKKKLIVPIALLVVFVLLLVGYFAILVPILNQVEVTADNEYYPVLGDIQPNTMYFIKGTYEIKSNMAKGFSVAGLYTFDTETRRFSLQSQGTSDGTTEYYTLIDTGYTCISPLPDSYDFSTQETYVYGKLEIAGDSFVSSYYYYESHGTSFSYRSDVSSETNLEGLYVFTPGYLPVDEYESMNANGQYLLFPQITRANMQSITITNPNGTFGFYRSASDTFLLKDYEDVPCDDIKFSALVTAVGYPLTAIKICNYATSEQLAEYGLDQPQASWTVETINGEFFSIEIGDSSLSQNGYFYARFVGRDSIYMLSLVSTIYSLDFSTSYDAIVVMQPVEFFVNPQIISGLSNSNYYMIDNVILLANGGEERIFYITNTILANSTTTTTSSSTDATESGLSELEMVYPAHYQVNSTLFWDTFYPLALGEYGASACLKLGASNEDYIKYGLDSPHRVLYFEVRTAVENGKSTSYVTTERITLYFSEQLENGTYAVVSSLFPEVIAEVSATDYSFIDTNLFDWISTYVFPYNIRSVKELTVETSTQNVTFYLNHSTDSYQYLDSYGQIQEEITYLLDVTTNTGVSIPNKEVTNFRQFYLSLLCITLKGQIHLSDEEIQTILADPSKRALRFSFTTTSNESTVLEFYYYTGAGRRLLVSVDGKVEFYISVDDISEIDKSLTQVLQGIKVDPYNPA